MATFPTDITVHQIGSEWVTGTKVTWNLQSVILPKLQIVASEEGSSASSLHLWARLAAYKDTITASGSPSTSWFFTPTTAAIQDSNYRLPAPIGSFDAQGPVGFIYHVGGNQGSTRKIVNGDFAEWYFDLGVAGPGETVSTASYRITPGYSQTPSGNVTTSFTVGTVTLSYDKNGDGASGVTSSGVRVAAWENSGFGITVAENGFQWDNHRFVKWNTAADGRGTDYLPGATYTGDSATLYAIWELTTKTVTYNANLPTGSSASSVVLPRSETANANVTITVGAAPTVTDFAPPYTFSGYNTAALGTGTPYAAGSDYSSQYSATLYAQWSTDYVRPSFSNVTIIRSDDNGDYQVDGTRLFVSGRVTVNPTTHLTNIPRTLDIKTKNKTTEQTSAVGTITTFTLVSGSTYEFSFISNANVLDVGTPYGVTLSFKDEFMTQYPATEGINSPLVFTKGDAIGVAFITFSTNARGLSAAFGGQAAGSVSGADNTGNGPGRLDVYMNTYFHGTTNITPALATSSTPGIVKIPTDGSITIDNDGTIHSSGLSYVAQSGGDTKEQLLSDTGTSQYHNGWREEKWSDGRLVKWKWQLFSVSGDFNSLQMGITNGTPFVGRPDVFVATGPIIDNNSTTVKTGWWVFGGVSNFVNNDYMIFGVRSGGSGRMLCEVRMEGHWQ